ncbi:uncharacterized protein [Macrobrachium rosenbergii]|uniref:uncharacterized protein isoform X1 n=1 Tax=Macrobrachium rosenbergii TaxID=79674 RepID=UPI0034D6F0BF
MQALALLFGIAAFFARGGTANFQQELAEWSQDLRPGYVIETSIIDGRRCHCKVPGSTLSSTSPTTTIITTTVTTSTILMNSTTSTTPEKTTTTPASTTTTSSTVTSSTSTTPVPTTATSTSTTTKPATTTTSTSTTTKPATTTTSTSTTTKPATTTTSTSTTTKPATTTTSTSTTTKPATTTTSTSTTTKPATTTTTTSTTTKPATTTTTTSTSTTTKPTTTTTTSTSTTTNPTTTTTTTTTKPATTTTTSTTTTKKTTQASGGCGSCSEDIHLNLANYNAETFTLHWYSPNYPSDYPDGCTCVLNVYLENPGTVDISFSSDSEIYDDSNCQYDRLKTEGDITNPDTLCDVYISDYGAQMVRMDDTELSFTATFVSVSGDSDRQAKGFDMSLLITLWDFGRSLKDFAKERLAYRKQLLLARNAMPQTANATALAP